MNDSSSSTTRITAGLDKERTSPRARQWNNAGSRCRGTRNMPYTSVSCVTGHSFRDTHTMPYVYWGAERQRERAPALGENAFCSCILDSTRNRCSRHSEAEWKNEGIRGRPKADHRAQSNQGRDEQTNQSRVWANAGNWVLNQFSWQGKNDFSVQLLKSEQEIAILWRYSSILNHESTTSRVNVWGQRKSEKRKGLVNNKMVGSGAKKILCQCHRSLWSSCDVWACDQLSVVLRSVESLSLFFNGRKVMQLDNYHTMVAWVSVKSLEV